MGVARRRRTSVTWGSTRTEPPRPEATASSSSGRTSPSPSCPTRSWTTLPRLSLRSRSWTTSTNTTTIVFTAYMREMAEVARTTMTDEQKAALTLPGGKTAIPGNQLKLPKTFAAFMEDHADLRGLIDTGKGDLQWERDIPPAALANLEKLASGDFKGNLGKIIHDIYQTAHIMFSYMPQGDHKKRAKYRFASKTLMRILPSSVKGEIDGLIEKKTITLDLYEILGKCTWTPV